MVKALIGQKIDQTQTFLENGKRIPVTEVTVSDNVVLQVKSIEKDQYNAVQVGIGTKKKPNKAHIGHSKKAGVENAPSLIREVAWEGSDELPKPGEVIAVETVFKTGDIVKVTGTSKGKGFAGGVKRHHFRGGPKTHGQSDRHRAPGSIGQGTTPGRVYKGKRMAGHMGVDTVTVSNLVVVDVDPENNKLYVLGLVPGNKKSMLVVTKTGEKKNFVKLLSVKLKEEEVAKKEAEKLAKEQAELSSEEKEVNENQTSSVENTDEAIVKEANGSDAVEKDSTSEVSGEEAQTATDTVVTEAAVESSEEAVSDAAESTVKKSEDESTNVKLEDEAK